MVDLMGLRKARVGEDVGYVVRRVAEGATPCGGGGKEKWGRGESGDLMVKKARRVLPPRYHLPGCPSLFWPVRWPSQVVQGLAPKRGEGQGVPEAPWRNKTRCVMPSLQSSFPSLRWMIIAMNLVLYNRRKICAFLLDFFHWFFGPM